MTLPFTGGCACGEIRFECNAEPIAMYNCHCRGCQKSGGAPYAPVLVVHAHTLRCTGTPAEAMQRIKEDPHAGRSSCYRCGVPLFSHVETMPDIVLVNAIALDDPGWFSPVADIWIVYAQPWVALDRHIPKVFKSTPVLAGDIV